VRRLILAVLPLFLAAEAGAQIMRRPTYGRRQPSTWVSAGASLLQPWTVLDGTTSAEWRFGNATQYAASLEKQLSGGATLGLRGTHARVPLTYRGTAQGVDADANVSQLFTTVHVASGDGFHTVFELTSPSRWATAPATRSRRPSRWT
jgi:hypothetical protein